MGEMTRLSMQAVQMAPRASQWQLASRGMPVAALRIAKDTLPRFSLPARATRLVRCVASAYSVRIGSDFNTGSRQAAVELLPTHQRPPLVQEYLYRPPIRHPAKNDQTFLEELSEIPFFKQATYKPAKNHAERKDSHAD